MGKTRWNLQVIRFKGNPNNIILFYFFILVTNKWNVGNRLNLGNKNSLVYWLANEKSGLGLAGTIRCYIYNWAERVSRSLPPSLSAPTHTGQQVDSHQLGFIKLDRIWSHMLNIIYLSHDLKLKIRSHVIAKPFYISILKHFCLFTSGSSYWYWTTRYMNVWWWCYKKFIMSKGLG